MARYEQPGAGEFRHGLFDCCDSCTDCLLAYLCPNCYAYCAAQEAGEGLIKSILYCVLYPFCLCCLRGSVRDKRGIEGGCCTDICTTYLCPCCSVIQMKREFHD